jgi:hypothetical protein
LPDLKSDASLLGVCTVSDHLANRVYFSDLLSRRCPDLAETLTEVPASRGIDAGVIPGTRDVWCRDYMLIQVDTGRFVQFRYGLSYLRGYEPHHPAGDCPSGAACIASPVVLDGGNRRSPYRRTTRSCD